MVSFCNYTRCVKLKGQSLLYKFVVIVRVKLNPIGLAVVENVFGPNELSDLNELVLIVCSLEEWLSHEYHASQHAAHAPDIKLVVIVTVSNKKLWRLEVPGSNTAIVVLSWDVEVCQPPIRNLSLAYLMIEEHIPWLDISVNDPFRVSILKSFQYLEYVEPYVFLI